MKKNRLKNYLKLGILLFGITLFLVNCERDKMELETNSKYSIKKITHNQIANNQKVIAKISNYRTVIEKEEVGNYQARLLHSDDYDFTIDTDKVMYLENTETGYHSYNFYLIRDNPIDDKLENLFLSLNDDGEYDTYIIKYDFSLDEFQNLSEEEIALLDTDITPIDFDTSVFNNNELEQKIMFESTDDNGLIWGYDCEESLVNINCSLCEPWYVFQLECSWVLLGSSGGGNSGSGNNSNSGNTSGSSSNNNGNGASPHGGSSSNNGTSIATTPSLPTLSANTPCDQLKKTTIDIDFKVKLQALQTNVNNATASSMNFETAFTQTPANINMTSFNYEYFEGVPNEETVTLTFPATNGLISAFMHTHYSLNHHSVFSLDDIKEIYDMAIGGHIYDDTFTAIVITKHGTTYALKFDSPQSLVNFGNQWFDQYWDINPDILPEWIDNKSGEIRHKFDRKIKPTKSVEKNEKNFAKFLDMNNIGMSLYKSNANFTQWSKVETNGDLTPCN